MSHLPGILYPLSLYWEQRKAGTYKEWSSCVVLKSGVFVVILWLQIQVVQQNKTKFRWCKTFTQNLLKTKTYNSSMHAWPFIILLTTPNQMYFLVIIMSMERAGRLDLKGRDAFGHGFTQLLCQMSGTAVEALLPHTCDVGSLPHTPHVPSPTLFIKRCCTRWSERRPFLGCSIRNTLY